VNVCMCIFVLYIYTCIDVYMYMAIECSDLIMKKMRLSACLQVNISICMYIHVFIYIYLPTYIKDALI